jgi:ABC-type polysaccharide/polyol phosphate transport system ATPase subunit
MARGLLTKVALREDFIDNSNIAFNVTHHQKFIEAVCDYTLPMSNAL